MPQPQMLNQQSGFCCEEILHSFVEDGASDSYWVSFCARTLFCSGLRCAAFAKTLALALEGFVLYNVHELSSNEIRTRGRWVQSENTIHCAMQAHAPPTSPLIVLPLKGGH